MNNPLEYLQQLSRNNDDKLLSNYLNFVSETKLFCLNRSTRDDTALINNLLTSKDSSNEGLVILSYFIEQCPREVLTLNILSWIQQAVKNLTNPENGSLSSSAFKVLGMLLELSSNFSEARKQIALTIIPKVLDHFIRESKGNSQDIIILNCLDQTLKTFGKSCGFHKEAISKLIFQHLDSSPNCVYIAGKCYLALATCGGPGVDNENYITAWQNHQKFLLNSLHAQLDHLFENVNETNDNHKKYRLEGNFPKLPIVNEKSLIKRNQILAKLFQGLAEFLKILLLGSFPTRKRILPESILGLVWRGLSINFHTLTVGQQSIDASSLVTVISKINLACLEILDALISSCTLNLISYSQLICRILTHALKWTEVDNWPFGVSKPHCFLKSKIYECLSRWLNISRSCSGIEAHLDDLIGIVISDINHEAPIVSLKVPAGKGKKKKEMKTITSLEYLTNTEMNAPSCEAALKFVSSLLNTTSTLMKSNHHKELQTVIVSKLISINQRRFPIPFSVPKCRLALYEALLALCQNCHHLFQPPVNYATLIFSEGIKDSSVEVSSFCLFSVRCIEKILRPICPTLDFPASEGNIDRLNISQAQDGEESFLLNDSKTQKMMKRKRSSQVTSTPLNGNVEKIKLISPQMTTPFRTTPFRNLADFENGANLSTARDESVTTEHEMSEVKISEENRNSPIDRLNNDIDNNIPKKRRILEVGNDDNNEEFPSQNGDPSNNSTGLNTPQTEIKTSNPESATNSPMINNNPRTETLEEMKDIKEGEHNSTTAEDKEMKDIKEGEHNSTTAEDSDNEMLNSFVDELA